MSPHKKDFDFPKWVDGLNDDCLRETVQEALVARKAALASGAGRTDCERLLDAADAAVDRIASGALTGNIACRRAADALRKYNTAAECAAPSTRPGVLSGRRR